ncbi:MAG: GNAT family N-acetyltransferase [Cyclobacteriaceae bacterium]
MAVIVRRLLESEIGLANDFFNAVYKVSRSIDNFRWEFLHGPVGPAVYVVAIDDSIKTHTKVVGIQAAIPLQFQNSNGEVVSTAKSEDTLVDPSYRGQKIFERMYELLFQECKKAGIDFIWGFTPAKKAFEKIGFEIPFQAHQALMVFRPLKAYSYLSSLNPQNRFVDKVKIGGLTFLSRFASVLTGVVSTEQLTVKKVNLQSKNEMIKKTSQAPSVYFLRMDDNYLEWRINKNPFGNQYENYHLFSGDKLIADVLVNFRPEGFGYIEQMFFLDGISEKMKKDVLHHVISTMKPKVNFIRALCFDTNDELRSQTRLLKRSGFVILKRGGHFVWRALGSRVLNPNDIFLTRLFTQGNQ